MGLRKYVKRIGVNILEEVYNHPSVSFLLKENAVVHGTIDPLQEDEARYLYHKYKVEDFKFNNGCNSFTQNYFLASIKDVFVEPDRGIAVKGFSSVIKESVFYDWYKLSIPGYLKNRLFLFWRIKKLDSAILFDGIVGLNYFHLHNDILPKLAVVEHGLANVDTPLIISSKLFYSPLFQFYYQLDYVRKNNWYVIPQGQYLSVSRLYIIKAKQFDTEAFKKLKEVTLGALKAPLDAPASHERIFINRKDKSGRYLNNFKLLEPVLNRYGFKTIYMEDLPFKDQIELINSSKMVVGIHGAGLTNLIYANPDSVEVIEIFPKNFVPTHYYWLCNALSIQYKAFFGGDLQVDGGFEVDVERFETILKRQLTRTSLQMDTNQQEQKL